MEIPETKRVIPKGVWIGYNIYLAEYVYVDHSTKYSLLTVWQNQSSNLLYL